MKINTFIQVALFVGAFILLVLVFQTNIYRLETREKLSDDTSKVVSQCLNETYHDTEINSYYGEQDDKQHTVSLKDVAVEKCEKIKDVMLSIN